MGEVNGGAPILIRHYTDPSCPFAFSAERQRLRLEWLYGDQIEWELHMVGLSEEPPGDAFPPERVASSRRQLQLQHGMPIDWRPVELGASLPACRAVVATRLHAPDREAPLLRRLRVLNFSGLDLDDPAVIDRAASEALIEPEELRDWIADPAVAPTLAADMRAARSPSPASRAQDYKLGGPEEERRYTCPSYELIRLAEPPADWPTASRVDLPGYRPVEAYEAALACLAVVATRLHAPDREAALLRRLRVLTFSALDLDDPSVIDRAASEALVEPEELRAWTADPAVEPALRADMRASRTPSPASRAQDYKLGGPEEERRYTCPSYELIRVAEPPPDWPTASRVDLPGYRPVEAYEAALANIAPELVRRPDPESVEEVLAWAGMPLATAEVAAVCDRDIADVRAELSRVATFLPVGGDGYWTAAA